jgi:hypothetical protein
MVCTRGFTGRLGQGLLPVFLCGGLALADEMQAQTPVPAPAKAAQANANTQFSLDGLVMTPTHYDREALAALPQSSVTVGTATYTGVSLWTLLSKASIITHPDIKNDILQEIVVATAADGYKVAISIGEIDPEFGNQPCLIALQQNGADFSKGGFARLVLPNDVKKGRWVYDLTELKVSNSP